jgi:hypothetical protein
MELDAQAKKLQTIIGEMNRLYQALSEVLRNERVHLLGAATERLTESNRSKELLLLKLRGLEKERVQSASGLSNILGMGRDNPRLLKIAEKMEAFKHTEWARVFRDLHKVLTLHIQHAQEQNHENEIYAGSALKVLQGAVQNIKQTITNKPTYGKQGQMAGSTETQSGNFVRREV